MKYKATFVGRARNAIGIFYPITDTVEAETEKEAFEKLGETYEINGNFKLTRPKTLIFEGAGWEETKKQFPDIGNCRIRTRLVNDEGTVIYLEIMGREKQMREDGPEKPAFVQHCYSRDCNEVSEWRKHEGKPQPKFSYTAGNLIEWVNRSLRCSFSDLLVVNDGSVRVHATKNPLF